MQTDTLIQINELGKQLEALIKKNTDALDQISARKGIITKIQDEILPELMDEGGIEEITLQSGSKIQAFDFVAARLKDQNTAFEWLRSTQNEGIIKNVIKVSLGRGEDQLAHQVKETLTSQGASFSESETIHHSTLTAFVKESLKNPELSETIPKEAFGVYEARRVIFK